MADCLYQCLHEAHLDHYYESFQRCGLADCESLSKLCMQDYSYYGVVSMVDRLRLFKLVQIVKSVQAEGVACQHPGLSQPVVATSDAEELIPTRDSSSGSGGAMPNPKLQALNSTQPQRNGMQKQKITSGNHSNNTNGQPDAEEHNRRNGIKFFPLKNHGVHGVPKHSSNTGVVSKEVVVTGTDSPVFKCKKTLRFSDSDEEDGAVNDENGEPKQSSGAFFVDVASKPKDTSSKSSSFSNKSHRGYPDQEIPQKDVPFNVSPIKRAQIIRVDRDACEDHAYFPSGASPTRGKQPVVEKVYHNAGYDYGIPATGMQNSPNKSIPWTSASQVSKICVCVRKRPLMNKEVRRKDVDIINVTGGNTVVVEEAKVSVDLSKYIQQHIFRFDSAFDETCTNEDVYNTAVKPLISCVFNRGSATCFAFGQTGAGKTYTLLGTKSAPGLYRLAANDLFETVHGVNERKPVLKVWVSFYEIYCGQLFDLLNKRKRLHVRENGKQRVCISGLMETCTADVKSLVQVIQYGNTARSTGTTGVNPHSSRSHAVLQLELRDTYGRVGRLSFIDLAGSERASDATGLDRQTRIEGAEINQSLLALKECIRSIDQSSQHTPYRQSKLTHILRDSFVGNSQTVMIANVAPTQTACDNTLNTLRYADRVKELKKEVVAKQQPPPSAAASSSQGSPSKKAASSSSSASSSGKGRSAEAAAAASSATAPSTRSPRKSSASLFHPSKIQYSSTPKAKPNNGQKSSPDPPMDLSGALKDAYETPIRGYKLTTRSGDHCRTASTKGQLQVEHFTHASSGSESSSLDGNNNAKNRASSQSTAHPPTLAASRSNSSGSLSDNSAIVREKFVLDQSSAEADGSIDKIRENLSLLKLRLDKNNAVFAGRTDGPAATNLHIPGRSLDEELVPNQGVASDAALLKQRPVEPSPPNSGTSTSGHSNKSDDDIIREHKEIMSHLDQVLYKAKAVMQRTTAHAADVTGATSDSLDVRSSIESTASSQSSDAGPSLAQVLPVIAMDSTGEPRPPVDDAGLDWNPPPLEENSTGWAAAIKTPGEPPSPPRNNRWLHLERLAVPSSQPGDSSPDAPLPAPREDRGSRPVGDRARPVSFVEHSGMSGDTKSHLHSRILSGSEHSLASLLSSSHADGAGIAKMLSELGARSAGIAKMPSELGAKGAGIVQMPSELGAKGAGIAQMPSELGAKNPEITERGVGPNELTGDSLRTRHGDSDQPLFKDAKTWFRTQQIDDICVPSTAGVEEVTHSASEEGGNISTASPEEAGSGGARLPAPGDFLKSLAEAKLARRLLVENLDREPTKESRLPSGKSSTSRDNGNKIAAAAKLEGTISTSTVPVGAHSRLTRPPDLVAEDSSDSGIGHTGDGLSNGSGTDRKVTMTSMIANVKGMHNSRLDHLRPFQELLGSPSNTRQTDHEKKQTSIGGPTNSLTLSTHKESAFVKVSGSSNKETSNEHFVVGRQHDLVPTGAEAPIRKVSVSPIDTKSSKTNGVDLAFLPIQPFPITPRENPQIAVPNVISKPSCAPEGLSDRGQGDGGRGGLAEPPAKKQTAGTKTSGNQETAVPPQASSDDPAADCDRFSSTTNTRPPGALLNPQVYPSSTASTQPPPPPPPRSFVTQENSQKTGKSSTARQIPITVVRSAGNNSKRTPSAPSQPMEDLSRSAPLAASQPQQNPARLAQSLPVLQQPASHCEPSAGETTDNSESTSASCSSEGSSSEDNNGDSGRSSGAGQEASSSGAVERSGSSEALGSAAAGQQSGNSDAVTTETTHNGDDCTFSPRSLNSSRSSSVQSAIYRAQNLLLSSHEEHLSELTAVCKQEMRLLLGVQTGGVEFEQYLHLLDQLLSCKEQSITTLQSHIQEFTNMSQTDHD